MISKIVAVGFKGLEFAYDLKQRTLVVGPNGSGKSAITDALILTVAGKIPGAGKTNQAVMDAFASNDKMFVGAAIKEAMFERRFIRNAKGKVTQKFQSGKSLVTKEKFISDFSMAGKPAIIDLGAFLSLSDQKKIDAVFELYPPEGDVMGLHDQIETATDELSDLNATLSKTEGIIEKLTADQAELELPAGTLAEITQEIERTTAEVVLARKNLRKAIQMEAEAEAEKKATEKVEAAVAENVRIEKENLAKAKKEEDPGEPPPADRTTYGFEPDYTARNSEDYQGDRVSADVIRTTQPPPEIIAHISPEPAAARRSIKAIMDTIEKAGCTACAAMLVAKKQLQKF